MRLVEQLIQAIEDQLGDKKPDTWNSDVQNYLESLQSMEDLQKDLEKDVMFLGCLRTMGVDNWSGYSDACDIFNEE